MKVCVHFFAQLRDIAKTQTVDVDLVDGANVLDLLKILYAKFPALAGHDKSILVGVDVEFVDRAYKLNAGDEIAIMPPVQGG